MMRAALRMVVFLAVVACIFARNRRSSSAFEALTSIRPSSEGDDFLTSDGLEKNSDRKSATKPSASEPSAEGWKTEVHSLIASVGNAIVTGTHLMARTDVFRKKQGQATVRRQPFVDELEDTIVGQLGDMLKSEPALAKKPNGYQETPLHFAARMGLSKTCRLLLQHGADVHAVNKHGQTPLHRAAMYGSVKVVQMLLDAGANKHTPDRYGASFEDYALSAGSPMSLTPFANSTAKREPRHDTPPAPRSQSKGRGDEPMCEEDGGYDVGDIHVEDDMCDIDKRTHLSPEEFLQEYVLRGRPVLLQGVLSKAERCWMRKETMMADEKPLSTCKGIFGRKHSNTASNGEFSCGPTAYPKNTNQDSCKEKCTVESFNNHTLCDKQDGSGKYAPTIGVPLSFSHSEQDREGIPLSGRYCHEKAPVNAISSAFSRHLHGQFFVNGRSGGATMHFHEAAYNVLYFGYKRWHLTSPANTGLTGYNVQDFLEHEENNGVNGIPITRCLQRPGDVMVIPYLTGHATVCPSGFCTGLGNIFRETDVEEMGVGEQRTGHTGSHGGHGGSSQKRGGSNGRSDVSGRELSSFDKTPVAAQAGRPARRTRGKDFVPLAARPRGEGVSSVSSLDRSEGASSSSCKSIAFVHVNKAGGTMMLSSLRNCCQKYLLRYVMADSAPSKNFWFHANADRQRLAVGDDAWSKAYKYALVRNPWARQFSMFNFLMPTWQSCRTKKGTFCEKLGLRHLPVIDEPWKTAVKDKELVGKEFRAWIHRLKEAYPLGSSQEYNFGSLGHGNEESPHFNASQMSWLVDENQNLLVDEIIKLENLTEEWYKIGNHLQQCTGETHTLPQEHANEGPKHTHYSYYYDDASKDIVQEYMAADARAFGYVFEQQG